MRSPSTATSLSKVTFWAPARSSSVPMMPSVPAPPRIYNPFNGSLFPTLPNTLMLPPMAFKVSLSGSVDALLSPFRLWSELAPIWM